MYKRQVLNAAGVSKISADFRDAGGVPINQAKIDARNYFQTIQTASVYYTYSATNVRLGELSLIAFHLVQYLSLIHI